MIGFMVKGMEFDRWQVNSYHREMTATISANGLLEIPAEFREADAIKGDRECDIERVSRGEYRLKVKEDRAAESGQSWVDVLLACPVKGWYEPLERLETTDDLKAPISFE